MIDATFYNTLLKTFLKFLGLVFVIVALITNPIVNAKPLQKILGKHNDVVLTVKFSPDGKLIATGGNDEDVMIWDARTGKLIKVLSELNTDSTMPIDSVAFSLDNKMLAAASGGMLIIWDLQTLAVKFSLQAQVYRISSLAFSHDSKILASTCLNLEASDGEISLWDMYTGTLSQTLKVHTDVWSTAFSPDDVLLASANHNQTITIWDVETGTLLKTLTGHEEQVNSVAFSPDGKTLLSGSSDKTIKFWDVKTGKLKNQISGLRGEVFSTVISPNGKMIASAILNQVMIWHRQTGKLVRVLKGHKSYVQSCAFSPDGKWLVSGASDRTIRLWAIK
ncbi:MAG: WD40 repeat domain-containing protein [Acidobacteriota bacterium]